MTSYVGRKVRLKSDPSRQGQVVEVRYHKTSGRDEPFTSPTVRVQFDGEDKPQAVSSSQLEWYHKDGWYS